jgi:enoyl-CoA hydratase
MTARQGSTFVRSGCFPSNEPAAPCGADVPITICGPSERRRTVSADHAETDAPVIHTWEYGQFRSELRQNEVIYDVDPHRGVARIIFNRPHRLNSIPLAGFDYVTKLVKRAERDDAVHMILFEGNGPCFGTGADASELGRYVGYGDTDASGRAGRPSQRRRMIPDRDILFGTHGVEQAVFRCFKPTVVKAHGYCYGGHLQIALAADIVIAGESAVFTHPAWRYLGPIFNFDLLIEAVGLRKAKEMVLTARPVGAAEAEQSGLITKAVPDADLDRWVDDYLSALSVMPRDGVAMGKAMMEQVLDARGAAVGSGAAWIGHGWITNLRFDSDEWNFLRARRDHGLTEALRLRDQMVPEYFRMARRPGPDRAGSAGGGPEPGSE